MNGYSEHPNWPANYGAYYVSQILDALTANPEVWSRTVLFVLYDENDGFFDHMVPPTPPQSAAQGLSTVPITNEIFPGGISYDVAANAVTLAVKNAGTRPATILVKNVYSGATTAHAVAG